VKSPPERNVCVFVFARRRAGSRSVGGEGASSGEAIKDRKEEVRKRLKERRDYVERGSLRVRSWAYTHAHTQI